MKHVENFFDSIDYVDGWHNFKSTNELTFFVWNTNFTAPHFHSNYVEIFVITKGSLVHNLNNKISVLNPGDVFFLMPGDKHQILPNNDESSQLINLTCYTHIAKNIFENFMHVNFESARSNSFTLSKDQFKIFLSYTNQILSSKSKRADNALLFSLITYLLSCTIIKLASSNKSNKDSLPEWLNEFLSKLNDVNWETTKICDLYKLTFYSQSVLSVQFKKYMNMSIVQYVDKLKMKHAASLLLKTNYTTLNIANMIGFSNLAHFNRLFKKHFELPPSEYRKKFQST